MKKRDGVSASFVGISSNLRHRKNLETVRSQQHVSFIKKI